MQAFHDFIILIDGYLWGPPMLVLLFGTHLFLTFRLGFIQKHVGLGIKLSVTKDTTGEGDVSQFGALTTALAATIGTGNIVGVATAVALGGPGAVLWCWLTGVFGIATKYAEALLAVKYRVKTSDGTMLGGPMYALEQGLNMRWLGILFAIFTSIAAFGIGNMTQANSISSMVQNNFGVSPYITGILIAIFTGIVIIGGVKSIANVCEKLVPFMAIFYVIGCLIILIMNGAYVGQAFSLIFSNAFSPRAAGGGFIGATVMIAARYGIARGLFSNESGLGSAPLVAAAAKTRNPVRQALIASTGTFWDTVIVCAMTGLVLVSSVCKDPAGLEGLSGAALSSAAFSQIPVIGPIVLTIGLLTFVFSTILGWSYYGERAVEYLFGKKGIKPYRVLWVIGVFCGSVMTLPLVWDLADAMNAMMAIPNVISLLLLSGVIAAETKKYLVDGSIDDIDDTPIPVIDNK
ncbi:MAG: alanine/glycine:cation symporter family protein [Clostridiaceae bacterium]|nr:alanine/glycine:cation symporter family protein [Clostridiaceae bacterium]